MYKGKNKITNSQQQLASQTGELRQHSTDGRLRRCLSQGLSQRTRLALGIGTGLGLCKDAQGEGESRVLIQDWSRRVPGTQPMTQFQLGTHGQVPAQWPHCSRLGRRPQPQLERRRPPGCLQQQQRWRWPGQRPAKPADQISSEGAPMGDKDLASLVAHLSRGRCQGLGECLSNSCGILQTVGAGER